MKNYICKSLILFTIPIIASLPAFAQQTAQIDFVSIGRGAPLAADINEYEFREANILANFEPIVAYDEDGIIID